MTVTLLMHIPGELSLNIQMNVPLQGMFRLVTY